MKSAENTKTGTKLRTNKEKIEDEESPHELFQTTRQTTKIRNDFPNNMSTDIKLTKISNIKKIQSDGSSGSWLCNMGKKLITVLQIL